LDVEMLRIYVDYREKNSSVHEFLRRNGVKVFFENLETCDYLVSDRVCVERKTVHDFVKSLFDGRLFDQASRMVAKFEKPVIIVEGEISKIREVTEKISAIYGALVKLMVEINITILWTGSSEDTAIALYLLAKHEQEVLKRAKAVIPKKPRTVDIRSWQRFVLQSFPGIGPKSAEKLLEKFGSLDKVFSASASELARIVGYEKAQRIIQILKTPYSKTEEVKKEDILKFFKS